MPEQRQQAKLKNQPAPINSVRIIRRAIMNQPMRKRVPKMRPGLVKKDVLNIGGYRPREHLIQLRTHLLKQGGNGTILLGLSGVIEKP